MKLVVTEPETMALRDYLRERPRRFTSRVAVVEVARAVAQVSAAARTSAEAAFEGVELIELTGQLATAAGSIPPTTVRTLDAVHLASVLAIADEVETVVTYDHRLADAARALGMTVVAPG